MTLTHLALIGGIVLLLFGGTILRNLPRGAGETWRELRQIGKEIDSDD